MTGFLEEAPGVRSMTRLAVAICLPCVVALTAGIIVAALRGAPAGILTALAGALGTLTGGIWGALRERA